MTFLFCYVSVCTGSLLRQAGSSIKSYKLLVVVRGVSLGPPALGAWSPSYWTTREIPTVSLEMHFVRALERGSKEPGLSREEVVTIGRR